MSGAAILELLPQPLSLPLRRKTISNLLSAVDPWGSSRVIAQLAWRAGTCSQPRRLATATDRQTAVSRTWLFSMRESHGPPSGTPSENLKHISKFILKSPFISKAVQYWHENRCRWLYTPKQLHSILYKWGRVSLSLWQCPPGSQQHAASSAGPRGQWPRMLSCMWEGERARKGRTGRKKAAFIEAENGVGMPRGRQEGKKGRLGRRRWKGTNADL